MLRINLGKRSYDIAVSTGTDALGSFAADRLSGRNAVVIADSNVKSIAERVVAELNSVGFSVSIEFVSPGESSKSTTEANRLYSRLAAIPADRWTAVMAVGGGVIGDLAGFVAATYARGLPLLMIPTSLLAMVDSAVGGKVGVNLPEGKNLVGSFHQPIGVWIDLSYLHSLPQREFVSGLAEVVKYGVIFDADLFGWLEEHAEEVLARESKCLTAIVLRSCELKARIVERDEFEETGLRAQLNFGHTFAHAFEVEAGYGQLLHGEAVSIGMVCATRFAVRRCLIGPELVGRLIRLLSRLGLPTALPKGDIDAWLKAIRRDKKAVGPMIRLVLPTKIGRVELVGQVDEQEIRDVLCE